MKCPNDEATLVMSERSGVEIDYCPECRGVWLDRGELDKILDRAASDLPAAAPPVPPMQQAAPQYGQARYGEQGYRERDQRPGTYDNRYGTADPYKKKRKESWLSDLFDG